MTLKNNRAPLLGYIEHCALFQSHQWIEIQVTIWTDGQTDGRLQWNWPHHRKWSQLWRNPASDSSWCLLFVVVEIAVILLDKKIPWSWLDGWLGTLWLPSNGGTLDAGVALDSTKLSFWATFSATWRTIWWWTWKLKVILQSMIYFKMSFIRLDPMMS